MLLRRIVLPNALHATHSNNDLTLSPLRIELDLIASSFREHQVGDHGLAIVAKDFDRTSVDQDSNTDLAVAIWLERSRVFSCERWVEIGVPALPAIYE